MRLRSCLVSLVVLCAAAGALAQNPPVAAPTCADLHLVPAPRECVSVEAFVIESIGLNVSFEKNALDKIAALQDLEESLASRGLSTNVKNSNAIFVLSPGFVLAKELLTKHHITFDPAMHDEGYVILPDGQGGLAVIAETSAGLFYGAQTVKQLIRGSGKDAVLLVPTLRDWPAMAHRGLSDDWSRGPLPNMDFLKREIRTLAAYKYNIFSPYFEHTFAYAASPVAAFPGGAMTAGRGARAGRLRGQVSHHHHPRAGVLRPPAPPAQVRAVFARWARRRTVRCWRPARPPRCR